MLIYLLGPLSPPRGTLVMMSMNGIDGGVRRSMHGLGPVPALPLACCVTLGPIPSLCLRLPIFKMGIIKRLVA